jgi:hypothetical protein
MPVDSLVTSLRALTLDGAAVRLVSTGRHATVAGAASGLVRLYDADQRFLGLGEVVGAELIPKRLMATTSAGQTATTDLVQATKTA